MKLATFAVLVPLSLLSSCSSMAPPAAGEPSLNARPVTVTPVAAPVARSAGDVRGTIMPGADATTIASLRAQGRPALDRLLAAYDGTEPGRDRDALAALIDRVAAQRYATASRLFWHTDLDAALAESRATGKPVLSLRMLGRLDEDLSCANSRFFRTALYPDPTVSALLRDRFVLHWSSERLVPRVTVDYGDGRKLETTITGNSAHYVLDGEGRPIDVLPGLYAPAVFARELEGSLALAATLRDQQGDAWAKALAAHHQRAQIDTATRWQKVRSVQADARLWGVLGGDPMALLAQEMTVTKARVELPALRTVDLGVDPGNVPDDTELWAKIGERMLDRPYVKTASGNATVLGPESRALIDSLLADAAPGVEAPSEMSRTATLASFERSVLADTALNEAVTRAQIHGYIAAQLVTGHAVSFTELNRWIYDGVFHTPASDPWLGLMPQGTFTGLPGGAIVTRAAS